MYGDTYDFKYELVYQIILDCNIDGMLTVI